MTRRPWLGLVVLAALAGAVCATGVGAPTRARLALPAAVVLGGAVGAGLATAALATVALAHVRSGAGPRPTSCRRVVTGAGLAIVLVAAGACEEIVWRGGVQVGLRAFAGPAGALAIAAVLFGAVHGPLRRRMATHCVTGAVFGAAFLLSGRLVAAVAAHGAYNLTLLAGDSRATA